MQLLQFAHKVIFAQPVQAFQLHALQVNILQLLETQPAQIASVVLQENIVKILDSILQQVHVL